MAIQTFYLNGDLSFFVKSANKSFVFNSSGIGINQPNPQYTLDVNGSGNFSSGLFTKGFSTSGALTLSPSRVSNVTLGNNPFYVHTGSATNTWSLPSIALSTGRTYFVKNRGATVTLTGFSASDKLFFISGVQSFSMNSGTSYILANDGEYWNIM